jgi:hypothetical protein
MHEFSLFFTKKVIINFKHIYSELAFRKGSRSILTILGGSLLLNVGCVLSRRNHNQVSVWTFYDLPVDDILCWVEFHTCVWSMAKAQSSGWACNRKENPKYKYPLINTYLSWWAWTGGMEVAWYSPLGHKWQVGLLMLLPQILLNRVFRGSSSYTFLRKS